ncbi:hypothetical protein, partial [Bifidobacterium saimiriisciurei]|uniref:hypothetical protein n=1 Tax=Bifidobacterium saimiriisciurei TaxID=2661627 RepID=UPI001CDC46CC
MRNDNIRRLAQFAAISFSPASRGMRTCAPAEHDVLMVHRGARRDDSARTKPGYPGGRGAHDAHDAATEDKQSKGATTNVGYN